MSVNKDFLDMTYGQEAPEHQSFSQMTLEGARGVLNLAQQLITSKHDLYQITGLRTTINIFNVFHERLMGIKNKNSH